VLAPKAPGRAMAGLSSAPSLVPVWKRGLRPIFEQLCSAIFGQPFSIIVTK